MRLQISGDGWTAECILTDNAGPDEFVHVQAKTAGITKKAALKGAETILDMLGRGRLVAIRTEPEAHTEKDFPTQEIYHRGYVRFSYLADGTERWQHMEKAPIPIPSIGAAS